MAMTDKLTCRTATTLHRAPASPSDFQQQTAGKLTLLYFGYTHCPDQCPTSMADIAEALRSVPPAVGTNSFFGNGVM